MTTKPPTGDENTARQRPPIWAVVVLAGSMIPTMASSWMPPLGFGAMANVPGIVIANLVIKILQFVMQIIVFVFIIEQIFIWEDRSPPPKN